MTISHSIQEGGVCPGVSASVQGERGVCPGGCLPLVLGGVSASGPGGCTPRPPVDRQTPVIHYLLKLCLRAVIIQSLYWKFKTFKATFYDSGILDYRLEWHYFEKFQPIGV